MSYVPPHLRAGPAAPRADVSAPLWSESSSVTPPPHSPASSGTAGPSRPAPTSTSTTRSARPLRRADRDVLSSTASDLKPMRDRRAGGSAGRAEDEMGMLESVSRSGGDGGQGDALKDWAVQDRYRAYIEDRLGKHYATYNRGRDEAPPSGATEELQSLGSIVLLFRKLREGVVASRRIDDFAIEAFESSARLALLAQNLPQLLSSLSGLVPGLYLAVEAGRASRKGKARDLDDSLSALSIAEDVPNEKDNRALFCSLLLLYHLVVSDSRQTFQALLLELTTPGSRRRLRQPFAELPAAVGQPDPPRSPSISRSRLSTATAAARALGPETFDPLLFDRLANDPSASPYERQLLGLARGRMRDRAWTILAKAYLSTDLAWAGRLLGLATTEVEQLAWEKGVSVVGERLKLR